MMEISVMITEPFERSRQIVEAEETLGLKIKPKKCEVFFLGDITEKRRSTILASLKKLCPGIKTPKKDKLSFLVHCSVGNHKQIYSKRKSMNWEKVLEMLKN